MKKNNKKGFTLAEILITLSVIGIVAAISLPALNQGVNERTWDTKRKALHSRMAAAILSMPQLKGFDSAELFLINGLSKIYKIKNICDSNHMDKCGMPLKFATIKGDVRDLPKTNTFNSVARPGAAFETENGEKLAVYYNPDCVSLRQVDGTSQQPAYTIDKTMCVNMIYDLNGQDEPNKIGKDMGVMSVIYGVNGLEVVAPNPYHKSPGTAKSYDPNGNDAATLCKSIDSKLTLPNIAELISITKNGWIATGYDGNIGFVSSSVLGTGNDAYVWRATGNTGNAYVSKRSATFNVICIKE